jgi:hypothetical protein
MPFPRPDVLGVELEHRFRGGDRRDGWMRNEGTQKLRESLMPSIVEMILAA